MENELLHFFFIVTAAALAPVLVDLIPRVKVPVVVVEIALGVLIGPQVLGLAETSPIIESFSQFGLAFLFFLAGFEIDFDRIKGAPLKRASLSWIVSLVGALALGGRHHRTVRDFSHHPLALRRTQRRYRKSARGNQVSHIELTSWHRPGFILLAALLLLTLNAACSASPSPATVTPTATNTPEVITATPVEEDGEVVVTATPEGEDEELVATPTLAPTATPDVISEAVSDMAATTGIDRHYFLGLSGEDWINLGFSVLVVLLGVVVAGRVVYYLLKRLTQLTPAPYDEEYVTSIKSQIKWFVGIFSIRFAASRLEMLSPEQKQHLDQFFFALYVVVVANMLWKLIDLGIQRYQERADARGEGEHMHSFLALIRRVAYFLLLIVALTLVLNDFGVNVTLFVALLGLSGLMLSLAGQSVLADVLFGFLILMDRPFRVGDRIEIEGQKTSGIVQAIDTRATRLITDDNRLIVVPNSKIGDSQVINYTYPDPRFRQQTEVRVGYASDIEGVEGIIREAVHGVEGVLPDRPIEVIFRQFGDSALVILVRWWIASYEDTPGMSHVVHKAILTALNQAGIEIPYHIYDVRLDRGEGENSPRLNIHRR